METPGEFMTNRWSAVYPLLQGTLLVLMGLTMPVVADAQKNDHDELRALNARFIHNYVTNNVISHDQILHARFVCITSKGAWVDRETYLKAWATGFDPKVVVYWDYRDEKIEIMGTTALVRSVNRFTLLVNGKETSGMSLYTDTYVKENGVWKCVQAQITEVSPENYPPDDTIVRKYVLGK